MKPVKRVEHVAKLLLALVASLLFGRPWRATRRAARLARAKKVLVVRVDNRVGEALLLTPTLDALKALPQRPTVDVLIHPKCARVLERHPSVDRLISADRKGLWMGPFAPLFRGLRRADYDVVINCGNWESPSVTHAIFSRMAGPHAAVVGPAVFPLQPLHTHPVPAAPDIASEAGQRVHLLSVLGVPPGVRRLSFRTPTPEPELRALLETMAAGRFALVNPGGRLGERRIPPEAFAAGARRFLELGRTPIVTWGPGEEALAKSVVDAAPGAVLAPKSSIDGLAALMQAAACTLCNNTGPMHLSVAVGAPTLALFFRIDMARWGHAFPPHVMTDLSEHGTDVAAHCRRVGEEVTRFVATLEPRKS